MFLSKRGFYHPITILILATITLSVAIIFYLNSNVLLKAPEPAPDNNIEPSSSPIIKSENFITPKYVSIYLTTSLEQSNKNPILILSTVAGDGCDTAGNLQISKNYDDVNLGIQIKGYDFKEGGDGFCPAVILESKVEIPLDENWLEKTGDKFIEIALNEQKNLYKIENTKTKIILTGINATNVISNEFGYNSPESPRTIELTL
ncbi:MAG: hypothetical protein UU23_C0002G0001 [Candidatus Curtissbacteria bacterium GW2011_GWA1_40_9]|uniref:Uncharacterized protein n=1 Tax=Candidatus Curtissbacteria bacterium GW2011_GWA1_40_9 TaxID=1618408 RepID=A0A0G0TMC8_9BACT|nr:MAG: hypothetical protein UU23_C0002G0001 [Candidatus Curtissbacteria bacterium GW2011_GWA1_40_9]